MQDRTQKNAALRYVVAKRWLPQLELDVSTYITIAKTATSITDIDVFASVPDDFVGFRSVVIDCKTKKGESPISRALWQKGLMERLGADRGVCVLRIRKIEADHRYTAAQLGVTLLAESEFAAYAGATAVDYSTALGAIAEIDRWDAFFGIGSRFQKLEPAIKFSRSGFWMSETAAEACTRTIILASALRPELDPERPEHVAIVADLTALLLHALARIVVSIFAAYLQPGQQTDLSRALRYFLYGGKSAYDHLNRIKRMIVESRAATGIGGTAREAPPAFSERMPSDRATNTRSTARSPQDAAVRDLQLPEWDRFVELVRQLLDAPLEVSRAPLLLREIGWAALGTSTGGTDGVTAYARTLALASPQGARFAVLGLDYLSRAAKLPKEFNDVITARLLSAQSKA